MRSRPSGSHGDGDVQLPVFHTCPRSSSAPSMRTPYRLLSTGLPYRMSTEYVPAVGSTISHVTNAAGSNQSTITRWPPSSSAHRIAFPCTVAAPAGSSSAPDADESSANDGAAAPNDSGHSRIQEYASGESG